MNSGHSSRLFWKVRRRPIKLQTQKLQEMVGTSDEKWAKVRAVLQTSSSLGNKGSSSFWKDCAELGHKACISRTVTECETALKRYMKKWKKLLQMVPGNARTGINLSLRSEALGEGLRQHQGCTTLGHKRDAAPKCHSLKIPNSFNINSADCQWCENTDCLTLSWQNLWWMKHFLVSA